MDSFTVIFFLFNRLKLRGKQGVKYGHFEDSSNIFLSGFPYDEKDYLDYKCPKKGEITELIVSKKARGQGIGKVLMNKMEEYFKSLGCEYILLDVFAYNVNAIKFYEKEGYHSRMYKEIKKIN
mgnify:CR=1 FL=1